MTTPAGCSRIALSTGRRPTPSRAHEAWETGATRRPPARRRFRCSGRHTRTGRRDAEHRRGPQSGDGDCRSRGRKSAPRGEDGAAKWSPGKAPSVSATGPVAVPSRNRRGNSGSHRLRTAVFIPVFPLGEPGRARDSESDRMSRWWKAREMDWRKGARYQDTGGIVHKSVKKSLVSATVRLLDSEVSGLFEKVGVQTHLGSSISPAVPKPT